MTDHNKSCIHSEIVRRMQNTAEAMIQMNGGLSDALRKTLYRKADEFGIDRQVMENILKNHIPSSPVSDPAARDDKYELSRFLKAQENIYGTVLSELRSGWKQSHWMWFIFPQIEGLGESPVSQRYAISSLDEAGEYLKHPVLGARLLECSKIILFLEGRTALDIFGRPDDLKLKSSMTLFSCVPDTDPVFKAVLKKYFRGSVDSRTIERIE